MGLACARAETAVCCTSCTQAACWRLTLVVAPSCAHRACSNNNTTTHDTRARAATGRRWALLFCRKVNTSGEESKFGVEPADCVALAQHIAASCKSLRLAGLMTIGMPDYSSRPENFACLADCRQKVAAALGVPEASLELSMGMSGDFEQAIEMGSNNIRVGSTIFGARQYPPK